MASDETSFEWPEVDPTTASSFLRWTEATSASELLAEWDALASVNPWGIEGLATYDPRAYGDDPAPPPHVALAFITHGNEWGTLPAALALLRALGGGALRPRVRVSILLGNLEAARADVRFVEEDFNRVFVFDEPPASLERQRALQVRPFLDTVDYLLDIHQTQTHSESAFWTFPWSEELALWARAMGGAPWGLTRRPGGAFAPGRRCLDEYVRDRGKMGITLEVGTRGADPVQARRALDASLRLIHAVEAHALSGRSLTELAESCPAITWYETVQVAETLPGMRLRPGLGCWTAVDHGERLSEREGPELLAAATGRVLFPKYQEPLPPEILRVAVPIDDPGRRYSDDAPST